MFSELTKQLSANGVLWIGVFETVYMTVLSTLFAYIIGLPLGTLLYVTAEGGTHPVRWLNRVVGIVVNMLRSVPFIILMVAVLPLSKVLVGTSLGNRAMIVTLVIAAAPYIARMVESSLKEVDGGVIEAAQSMGVSGMKLIFHVLLPEARPSLIIGAVISTVTVLGYSAMAGTVGGGGLGQIAITYGFQRFNNDLVWICVALTIIIVQVIQEVGMRLAHKTDKRIKA